MKALSLIFLLILVSLASFSGTGEVLKFDLKFGILKGGEAVLTIRDTTFNGVKAIQYHIVGKTTGLTDRLFNVHDTYETIVDAKTNLPLKSIRNIKEQKYRYYNETFFYQDIDSLYSQKKGGRKTPDNLLDIISIFFYFVKNNYTDKIESGEQLSFPTYHIDKIDDIQIKYLGIKTVETDLGNIDCYSLSPRVDKGKVLNRSDGLQCFISIAEKIPVQMEFEMKVGTLRAVLKNYIANGVNKFKRAGK